MTVYMQHVPAALHKTSGKLAAVTTNGVFYYKLAAIMI
jgi:hypothetical protein